MPGTRLNDTERGLAGWWNSEPGAPYPFLSGISIHGDPGLRGIRNLDLEFKYPVTVVSGRNGSGKTTILGLSALGFHSPAGHIPLEARRNPKDGEDFTYYTFSDFFYKGPGDPDIEGVRIDWSYYGHSDIGITKKSRKWMHYDRRPDKPVHYVGVQRCVPAIERSVLRSHFGRRGQETETSEVSEETVERLSDIMGKEYNKAQIINSPKYSIGKCVSGSPYSSFNMGAGEDILLFLLHLLQETPDGSLIVIEEIEIGLHPEAVRRLARHLQQMALEKRLQLIISSHSQYFIDSLPREARLLVQDGTTHHTVIYEPTTRFALGLMSGRAKPELWVYCEDNFSSTLIQSALDAHAKRRVKVVPVGGKDQIELQARHHCVADLGQDLLLVWDGDVGEHEIDAAIDSLETEDAIDSSCLHYWRLPGGTVPEEFVLDELDSDEGAEILGEELRLSVNQVEQLIERLRSVDEHRQVGYEMSESLNLDNPEDAVKTLIRSVSRLDGGSLETLTKKVETVLDGDTRVTYPPGEE